MWNLSTKKLHQNFTGHSSQVLILKSFEHDDNQYILSGSKYDRQVSIWKIDEDEKEAATSKKVIGNFSLNGSPTFLSWQLIEDELQVACVATDDSLLYYTVNLARFVHWNSFCSTSKIRFYSILALNLTKSQSNQNIKHKLHQIILKL